jgi:hypothetical protein
MIRFAVVVGFRQHAIHTHATRGSLLPGEIMLAGDEFDWFSPDPSGSFSLEKG